MAPKTKKKGLKKKRDDTEAAKVTVTMPQKASKVSPKTSPKTAPKMSPKLSPKKSPKASPKDSPETEPSGTKKALKDRQRKQKRSEQRAALKAEGGTISDEQKAALKKEAIKVIQEGVAKRDKSSKHHFVPSDWSTKYGVALGKYKKFVASLPELFEIRNLDDGGSAFDIVLVKDGRKPASKGSPDQSSKAPSKKEKKKAAKKAAKESPKLAPNNSPKVSAKADSVNGKAKKKILKGQKGNA